MSILLLFNNNNAVLSRSDSGVLTDTNTMQSSIMMVTDTGTIAESLPAISFLSSDGLVLSEAIGTNVFIIKSDDGIVTDALLSNLITLLGTDTAICSESVISSILAHTTTDTAYLSEGINYKAFAVWETPEFVEVRVGYVDIHQQPLSFIIRDRFYVNKTRSWGRRRM